ncbi:MAG TPA: peptide deformylase [Burkholderiaceae bacterium]|nr:peptide deformylase [Burkholderiaceae bacterium]HYA76371.1 peptide deformylase [Burkholderiaceae bacterium]
MAVRTIIEYPDRRLHQVAEPVTAFDEGLQRLVQDMGETMYASAGVGLAATQIDVGKRVIVMDLSEAKNELRVFVNPIVLWSSTELATCEEGCLSVPGVFELVQRPAQVRVRAQDLQGAAFELECSGTLAVCVQHEIDHLDGKVFVERLSLLKQARVRAKLRKQRARR